MAKKKARADGRYQGKILVGVIDGKPKYKYVYAKTEKELKDRLAVLRVELGKGVDLTQPTSLSFWIDRFLARTEQTQTEEWHATCEARAERWRAYLGKADITQITTADLEDVLLSIARCNPVTGKPSSKKTVSEYASVIRRVFALAVRNRAITYDPSAYMEITTTAPKHRRDAITDAQIAAIRQTPHECRLPCLIMIYAGLRLGEVAALTWSDIDLQTRSILVNKSYNFKTCCVKSPKTAAGTRTVPIPAPLLEALTDTLRTALLVCPHNGRVYTRSAWEYALEQYGDLLGFTVHAHELRHTYATILYEAEVDVLTAQHLLGHADSQTTMQIYTHLRDAKRAASVAKLDAYLSPKKEPSGVASVSE